MGADAPGDRRTERAMDAVRVPRGITRLPVPGNAGYRASANRGTMLLSGSPGGRRGLLIAALVIAKQCPPPVRDGETPPSRKLPS
jgi:hypothetical protein